MRNVELVDVEVVVGVEGNYRSAVMQREVECIGVNIRDGVDTVCDSVDTMESVGRRS
jgi:hypothetical protein